MILCANATLPFAELGYRKSILIQNFNQPKFFTYSGTKPTSFKKEDFFDFTSLRGNLFMTYKSSFTPLNKEKKKTKNNNNNNKNTSFEFGPIIRQGQLFKISG